MSQEEKEKASRPALRSPWTGQRGRKEPRPWGDAGLSGSDSDWLVSGSSRKSCRLPLLLVVVVLLLVVVVVVVVEVVVVVPVLLLPWRWRTWAWGPGLRGEAGSSSQGWLRHSSAVARFLHTHKHTHTHTHTTQHTHTYIHTHTVSASGNSSIAVYTSEGRPHRPS